MLIKFNISNTGMYYILKIETINDNYITIKNI